MNLHQLPLFQGIEHRDMQNIVAHTRFDFHKAEAGQTIVSEGDPMHHLLFVLGGTIHATRQSDSRRYSITETLNAPLLIHPEHLFGLHPAYPRTIVAATDLHLVAVGKEDVLRLAKENLVSHTALGMPSEGLLHVSRGLIALPALGEPLTPTA